MRKSCSPSRETEEAYFGHFTCPDTLWLPKTVRQVLGYATDL